MIHGEGPREEVVSLRGQAAHHGTTVAHVGTQPLRPRDGDDDGGRAGDGRIHPHALSDAAGGREGGCEVGVTEKARVVCHSAYTMNNRRVNEIEVGAWEENAAKQEEEGAASHENIGAGSNGRSDVHRVKTYSGPMKRLCSGSKLFATASRGVSANSRR